MSRRKLRDATDARRCLEDAATSGLTRAEWARANGIDGRSLNAWHLNLNRTRYRQEQHLRLVELVPAERVAEEPVRYTVRCGGELAVEVDHRFDEDVLRRLLRVVASC